MVINGLPRGSKKNFRGKIMKLGIFAILILTAIFVVTYFDLSEYSSQQMIKEKVDSFGMLGPIYFIVFYIITTIFFLPGTPATIASGVIFGAGLGTFYTVIGATIGAVIAFIFARYFGKNLIQDKLETKFKKLNSYDEKLRENGFQSVMFFRIVPIFPFNGLNFALGVTKVSFSNYFFGTLIGIVPGSFALAYLGDSLAELSVVKIILAVALLIALIFSAQIFKFLKRLIKK